MGKIIGRQQRAYSRERNIGSILLNLLNTMDFVNKNKIESLILLVDLKKPLTPLTPSSLIVHCPPSTSVLHSGDGSSYSSQEDRHILLLKICHINELEGVKYANR
jgi:hypothetical protein